MAIGLVIVVSGCSHKATQGDGAADEVAQDAGTDAVPQDTAEQAPSAAGGLESLPTDEKAAASTSTEQPPAASDASASASSEPSLSGETTQYTVHAGDTLMKIAFDNYGDLYQWKKIYDMNKDHISDPNRLEKGTTLTIDKLSTATSIDRNGERYLIKMGDTLGRISDDVYGTEHKWKKLWENNKQMIKDPNRIYAGFYLYYMMTDEDQREKEEFLKNKESKPLAEAVAPAAPAIQQEAAPVEPAKQEAKASKTTDSTSGLIDPSALSLSDKASGDARAPSSTKGSKKK